jgi:hypothetical protein
VASAQEIRLEFPVACTIGENCFVQNYVDRDPSPQAAADYQCGTLSYDGHNGTDIRLTTLAAQRVGVDVLAAADGVVARIRDGVSDVSVRTIGPEAVHGQECGNAAVIQHQNGFESQYCHMANGSMRVRPGERVTAGQPIGQIGLSGLTEYPHLHFTLRHQGQVVDPFAFGAQSGSCGGGQSLWAAATAAKLNYRATTMLNVGFSTAPVTMNMVEEGEAGRDPPRRDSPALIAFVRAIGLQKGDVQRLKITGPGREVVVDHSEPPLTGHRAQSLLFAGRRMPANGWGAGYYRASYTVIRRGETVLTRDFSADIGP